MGKVPTLQPPAGEHPPTETPEARAEPKVRSRLFTYRAALIIPLAGPIAWLAFASQGPTGYGRLAAGFALVIASQMIRLASVRWIGKRARVHRSRPRELIVSGPFRRVRNPIYVANIGTTLGLAVLAGAGPSIALGSVAYLIIIYTGIIRHEEEVLRETFGESYDAYCRETPRWMPALRASAPSAAADPPWPWPEVLYREGGGLSGILFLVGLIVWVREDLPGAHLLERLLDAMGGVLGLTAGPFVFAAILVAACLHAASIRRKIARRHHGIS